jgi:hypothetical protein
LLRLFGNVRTSLLAAVNIPTLLVQEGGYISPQLGACLQLFLAMFQRG